MTKIQKRQGLSLQTYSPSCVEEDKKYENEEEVDCVKPLPLQRGHHRSVLGFCWTLIARN